MLFVIQHLLYLQLIKVGFDSCSISFLIKEIDNLNADSVDFCEAGRFSAFISEEMKMYPCSFMINKIEGEDFKFIREQIEEDFIGGI